MDQRLLEDAVADLDRMATAEDAVMFRGLYLQAFKDALKIPREEGLAPGGVRVRVEIEGLNKLEVSPGSLDGDFKEALVGTCTGIATAAFIALIVGTQGASSTLLQLPAECVRLIARETLKVSEGEVK